MSGQSNDAMSDGVVTLSSPYPFEETARRLRDALTAKGVTLFLELDQQAAATTAGLSMPAGRLFLFGNPKGGTPVMVAVPQAGLDLPFKAWIWASSGGQVFITYNDPDYLKRRYGLSDSLAAPLAGIDALLHGVVG